MNSLFIPDDKQYCCGEKAEKQRFAKKWKKIEDENLLSERVKSLAKKYTSEIYDALKLIPLIKIEVGGSVKLEWGNNNHIAILYVDAENSFLDVLVVDYLFYHPVSVDKIKELLK